MDRQVQDFANFGHFWKRDAGDYKLRVIGDLVRVATASDPSGCTMDLGGTVEVLKAKREKADLEGGGEGRSS